MTIESMVGKGIYDFFDLSRYGIAPQEIRIIKDGSEESLGQEVLDEHLVDDVSADPGVK